MKLPDQDSEAPEPRILDPSLFDSLEAMEAMLVHLNSGGRVAVRKNEEGLFLVDLLDDRGSIVSAVQENKLSHAILKAFLVKE